MRKAFLAAIGAVLALLLVIAVLSLIYKANGTSQFCTGVC
jgi:hypothetical protein